MVQGIGGEIQKLEMVQSQLKQGPIWAQRCPAWKADVQRIDACIIDREGESEQSHRPQCQTVTAIFQWPRKRLGSGMCMFDEHRVLRAISLGAAWPAKAYKYRFPPSLNVTHRVVRNWCPLASGQSRPEFRPLTFRDPW